MRLQAAVKIQSISDRNRIIPWWLETNHLTTTGYPERTSVGEYILYHHPETVDFLFGGYMDISHLTIVTFTSSEFLKVFGC